VALGLLRATRPRQWVKNVLVATAPATGGLLVDGEVLLAVAHAFVALTLVAAGAYLLNDVADAEEDRAHPLKWARPVASGVVSARSAVVAGLVLIAAGLALAAALSLAFLAVIGAYLALTVAYTVWLRGLVILDLAAVAALFVLRVLAGGVATGVPVSRWLLIVTTFGAVFVVAGKRHGEQRRCPDTGPVRATLRRYSPRVLAWTSTVAALAAGAAYGLWSLRVAPPAGPSPWYRLSILPFVGVLARYAAIARVGGAGAPEDVLLGDRVLLALVAVWLFAFGCGAYVGT
jgi:decaprenyl-phosphate phosphoribosyltransferase